MTTKKITRQYGLWDSPIHPLALARGVSFSDVAWDESGTLVWREQRGDRGVLVVQPPDGQAPRDLNSDFSARARVGYGGGDFTIGHGQAIFVEAGSGRLYRQPLTHGPAHPITPEFGFAAAPALSPDGRWLIFVHTYEGKDSLGIVDCSGQFWPAKLVYGNDFYMQPRWHPSGQQIAWIAWDYPKMPWDGALLYLGRLRLEGGRLPLLETATLIAGDENTSVFQPEFSPDGRYLTYVSDQSGWWQLYSYDLERGEQIQITHENAEHGAPAWSQGLRTYAFNPDGQRLYYLRNEKGQISLHQVDFASGSRPPFSQKRLPLDEAYTWLNQPAVSPDGKRLAFIASGDATPPRIITYDLGQPYPSNTHIWRRGTAEDLPPTAYSRARFMTW